MTDPVVIVGGGPAGLATAACLTRRGIDSVVLDRGQTVGQSWASRYERLRLHTPRIQSHLPGYRIPKRMGRWVRRNDMVRYLQEYAVHHQLRVELETTVTRVDRRKQGGYLVSAGGAQINGPAVVIATGYSQEPFLPDWPGLDTFSGVFLHSSDYRSGEVYSGRDVLVVGAGNTGAEIATDLVEQGAGRVRMAVRTPPNVIPRQVGPIPTTLLGIANDYLPPAMTDPLNRLLQKVTIGDLTRFGLPAPPEGVVAQMRHTDVVPTIDMGIVAQLRAGEVEPVPAVVAFRGDEVELDDGSRIDPGVVIAATGYRRRLEEMVGHLGVLNDGAPRVRGGRSVPEAPNLHFVGLSNPVKGLLLQINLEARAVARALARSIGEPSADRKHLATAS